MAGGFHDEKIKQFFAEGLPICEIAKRIGISYDAYVSQRLIKMGLKTPNKFNSPEDRERRKAASIAMWERRRATKKTSED